MQTPPAYTVLRTFPAEPPALRRFPRHYLLYALDGLMRLEQGGKRWSLPPARAAWIAADAPITISIERQITCCSLLFSPTDFAAPSQPLSVFDMTPLLRETMLELRPYTEDSAPLPPFAQTLFALAATLAERLSTSPSRTWMPSGQTEALRRALVLTEENLENTQRFHDIAEAVHLTPRTLARRFADELGMTWRQAQRRLRMIHAVEALATTQQSITAIAYASGYNGLSAFNAAFREFTAQTPSEYRQNLRAVKPPESW